MVRARSTLIGEQLGMSSTDDKSGSAAGWAGQVVMLPKSLGNLACLVDVPLHTIDYERILS